MQRSDVLRAAITLFFLLVGLGTLTAVVLIADGGPLPGDEVILLAFLEAGIGAVFPPQIVFEVTAVFVVVVMTVLLWRRGNEDLAIGSILAGIAPAIGSVLKVAVDRTRPFMAVVSGDPYSFPSNSTLLVAAVALWIISSPVRRRGRGYYYLSIIMMVLAVLTGIQRIAVAEHWPSDVLGGWLTAGTWVLAIHLVMLSTRRDQGRV